MLVITTLIIFLGDADDADGCGYAQMQTFLPFFVIARSEESRRATNDEAIPLTYGRPIIKGIASSFPLAALEVAPCNDKMLV